VDDFRLYPATVTRIVDGDTVDVDISLGFYVKIHERLRLCLSNGGGINAPEPRGETRVAGKAATAHLVGLLKTHAPDGEITVRTFRDRRGKYGRFLASIEVRGKSGGPIKLCDLMVAHGHAVEKEY
jgi:micrococcal nuclease